MSPPPEALKFQVYLVVCNEAKVFGFVVFASVDGSLDFDNVAELLEMCTDVILGDVIFELAHVDLALLGCSLFYCDLLALDDVLLSQNFVECVDILEDDECEAPGKEHFIRKTFIS